MDERSYRRSMILIKGMIDNLLQMLGQFYIIVSKHVSGQEYNEFQFLETNQYRAQLYSMFGIVSSPRKSAEPVQVEEEGTTHE